MAVLLLAGATVPAMGADRLVLAEQITATWCSFCPNASHGLDMMMTDHPDTFTVLKIHAADSYATAWGNSRQSYYGSYSYPTVWIDGANSCVGAGSPQSAYNCQNAYYNQRMNVSTGTYLELYGEAVSGNTYEVQVDLCQEPGGSPVTGRFHVATVLDHYPSHDPHYRNCFRRAAPMQIVTLQPGTCQSLTANFTFDSIDMNAQDDIKVLAWFHTNNSSGPAAIYNSGRMFWPFMPSGPNGDFDRDGDVDEVDFTAFYTCMDGPDQSSTDECIARFDFDENLMVDAWDYSVFQTLYTGEPPIITTHPQNTSACIGDTVVLTCEATGSDPLQYQWYRGIHPIEGEVDPTFTLEIVDQTGFAYYACEVSNFAGTVRSNYSYVSESPGCP